MPMYCMYVVLQYSCPQKVKTPIVFECFKNVLKEKSVFYDAKIDLIYAEVK